MASWTPENDRVTGQMPDWTKRRARLETRLRWEWENLIAGGRVTERQRTDCDHWIAANRRRGVLEFQEHKALEAAAAEHKALTARAVVISGLVAGMRAAVKKKRGRKAKANERPNRS